MFRRCFPKDLRSSILDLGCGYGALLYAAKKEGYEDSIGVDCNAEQVKVAHSLGVNQVIHGDLVEFVRKQDAQVFDVIVTFDVIEHLPKREILALAGEIRRLLRSGGRWVIHVPNGESPFGGRVRYGDFSHELAFTQKSLRAFLDVAGFPRVECFEDTPVPHGLVSFVRYVFWKVLRTLFGVCVMIETGERPGACIFSQNLLAVAWPDESLEPSR